MDNACCSFGFTTPTNDCMSSKFRLRTEQDNKIMIQLLWVGPENLHF